MSLKSIITRATWAERSRRIAIATSAAVVLLATAWQPAKSAELKEINFVEAVHNLGYINLYVGQHAGIFAKNGLKLNLSAAGGDTQAFAAVLGKSSPFAIGDATMVQMSREAGGPGIVVGTVVQRAHYFGVSKNLPILTDPKEFKGLTVVTSPDPNTNYSVTKKLLLDNDLKPQIDTKILEVNPGTEIGAMLSFDCASGTMDARPDPGESGRFDVPGTWTRGQPVFMVGQEPAPQPARYIGRITGRTIQFTITILETDETIGVYEATLGREPELYFCN